MSFFGTCQVFPPFVGSPISPQADDLTAFNQDVSRVPKHPSSDAWIAQVASQNVALRCRLGNAVQIFQVGAKQPMVPVRLDKPEHYITQRSVYQAPLPAGAENLEDGDHHMLVVQQGTCKLYELWSATENPDGSWSAGASICWDLSDPTPIAPGVTSVDAAGLPMMPGLLRHAEVAAGHVRHAIRTSFPRTQQAAILPANHFSGEPNPSLPPMGARLRLREDWYRTNINRFPAATQARVVVAGLRHYGMIVADNGGFTVNGAGHPGWAGDQDAYMELYAMLTGQTVGRFSGPGVPGSAFEFVTTKAPIRKGY